MSFPSFLPTVRQETRKGQAAGQPPRFNDGEKSALVRGFRGGKKSRRKREVTNHAVSVSE